MSIARPFILFEANYRQLVDDKPNVAVLPWGGIKQSTREITIPANANWNEAARDHVPPGSTIVDVKEIRRISPGTNYEGTAVPEMVVANATYRWEFQIAGLNIGVLFILGVLSLAIYGVVLGGWASNNKYSFLGGLRATAQMVSYEIPLGLSVLAIVLH